MATALEMSVLQILLQALHVTSQSPSGVYSLSVEDHPQRL